MTEAENMDDRIKELEGRLAEAEDMLAAIRAGEVDGFAVNINGESEVYTLQSGDYAYRVLVENIGEGALNITEEGLIVYTNSSFCRLLGYSYEQVIGHSIFDLVHATSREAFNILFREGLNGNGKAEVNLRGADNNPIPVYVSLTSLQPKMATLGMVVTDFRQKKKNEETILQYQHDLENKNSELVKSNSELASFAYVASHDLQEPLRKIKTFASRLSDKQNDSLDKDGKFYISRMLAATERMEALITSLLDYSRNSSAVSNVLPTNLNSVVKEVASTLLGQKGSPHLTIEPYNLPTIKVVPFQFHQLFLNLIGNAIKYRVPGVDPVIKITAAIVPGIEAGLTNDPSKNYWKIEVKDNGIGFEQKYSEQIFNLFQRLHGRSEYEGTGIGLAICRKIVQNHGGTITAHSQPGEGATFSIYLPVSETA